MLVVVIISVLSDGDVVFNLGELIDNAVDLS